MLIQFEKFLNDDGSENQKTVVEYVTEVFKKTWISYGWFRTNHRRISYISK